MLFSQLHLKIVIPLSRRAVIVLILCGLLITSCIQPKSTTSRTDPKAHQLTDRPLYGTDNRVELVHAGRSLCHAGATVSALLPRKHLNQQHDGEWVLSSQPQLIDTGWCTNERFATQQSGVLCSAFLISPNRLVTAAHCLNAADDRFGPALNCEDIAFVFDHRLNANGNLPTQYTQDQIYFCKRVIAGENTVESQDWRVIELDRAANREPLPLLTNVPENLSSLAIDLVGHPMGLPLKASIRGSLKRVDKRGYFLANIDAFEGNSGSPVIIHFDEQPVVIGMLIRGEVDHELDKRSQCKITRVCSGSQCLGERVLTGRAFSAWARNSSESLNDVPPSHKNKSLCF